jgi:hypothetical protein
LNAFRGSSLTIGTPSFLLIDRIDPTFEWIGSAPGFLTET